jgi:glycosyltransferase involved in cell wall biosynthesis
MNIDSVHIFIIGEGAERKDLELRVKTLGLKNVSFLGLLPKIEMIKWLQYATATVFTTLNNPIQDACSPNKVFDSFAAGIPVIQTTSGWLKDLFETEDCGINVQPDNPKAIADAIILISSNEKLREKLAGNANRLAQDKFNRNRLAFKYLNALLTLDENSDT